MPYDGSLRAEVSVLVYTGVYMMEVIVKTSCMPPLKTYGMLQQTFRYGLDRR